MKDVLYSVFEDDKTRKKYVVVPNDMDYWTAKSLANKYFRTRRENLRGILGKRTGKKLIFLVGVADDGQWYPLYGIDNQPLKLKDPNCWVVYKI